MGRKASFEELREEAEGLGARSLTLHHGLDIGCPDWFARCDVLTDDYWDDTAHVALLKLVRALRVARQCDYS